MIAAWMLYALVVAALLALGAWAAGRALRLYRRPVRWVWSAALLLSALAPVVVWHASPAPDPDPVSGVASAEEVALGPISVISAARLDRPAPGSFLYPLDSLLLPGWIAASGALTIGLVFSLLAVIRSRRGWRAETVAGADVLVSAKTGPAVVGFLRPAIVLPAWALQWDEPTQRMVIEHEREHVRARDPLLLMAAAMTVLLMPWNAPLWWQLLRLRLAVETDCDARVLRHQPNVQRYGRLLLDVAQFSSAGRFALPAFSEPRSLLERRIRTMTAPRSRTPLRWALALLALAAAVPVAVFAIPVPDRPEQDIHDAPTLDLLPVQSATAVSAAALPAEALAQPADRGTPRPDAAPLALPDLPAISPMAVDTPPPDPSRRPTFTPYEASPAMQNREELVRAVQANYPPALREAGVGGTVRVWVFIDRDGAIGNTRAVESSGHPELDEAAERAIGVARFTAAVLRDEPVPVWVQFPITFQSGEAQNAAPVVVPDAPAAEPDAGPPAREDRAAPRDAAPRPDRAPNVAQEPTFTPYEVQPEMQNRAELVQAIERLYPRSLKDQGIGGTVRVWVFIDESGRVGNTRVVATSGHPELDRAAQQAMREARFSPARNRDQPVNVWVQFPITFQGDADRGATSDSRR